MRSANVGDWDRAGRMLTGIVLLNVALDGFVSGGLEVAVVAIAAAALVTGLVGWCPSYALFGASTNRITA